MKKNRTKEQLANEISKLKQWKRIAMMDLHDAEALINKDSVYHPCKYSQVEMSDRLNATIRLGGNFS